MCDERRPFSRDHCWMSLCDPGSELVARENPTHQIHRGQRWRKKVVIRGLELAREIPIFSMMTATDGPYRFDTLFILVRYGPVVEQAKREHRLVVLTGTNRVNEP